MKAVGEKVEQSKPIVEIETAKAVHEVAAPVSGRLFKLLVSPGESTPVNAELALIEDGDG